MIDVVNYYLDEIFDRISAYFPINFVPPKNDKFQISPEQLKERLSKCFVASNMMAKLAMPFVLEKLSSPSVETKYESLDLIKLMFE